MPYPRWYVCCFFINSPCRAGGSHWYLVSTSTSTPVRSPRQGTQSQRNVSIYLSRVARVRVFLAAHCVLRAYRVATSRLFAFICRFFPFLFPRTVYRYRAPKQCGPPRPLRPPPCPTAPAPSPAQATTPTAAICQLPTHAHCHPMPIAHTHCHHMPISHTYCHHMPTPATTSCPHPLSSHANTTCAIGSRRQHLAPRSDTAGLQLPSDATGRTVLSHPTRRYAPRHLLAPRVAVTATSRLHWCWWTRAPARRSAADKKPTSRTGARVGS